MEREVERLAIDSTVLRVEQQRYLRGMLELDEELSTKESMCQHAWLGAAECGE